MTIKRIKNLNNALDSLDATAFARTCAVKKTQIFIFQICDIKLSAALILKQESISVGGDFIVPKELILGEQKSCNGVLIATALQLEKIIAKCAIQPFGLKTLSKNLTEHIRCELYKSNKSGIVSNKSYLSVDSNNFVVNSNDSHKSIESKNYKSPQIMAIINITEDSFYVPSRVNEIDKILQKIDEMIKEGVAIIDIGAASSRPDSKRILSKVELARLKEPIEAIFSAGFTQKAIFSIDSYNYECVEFCINRGFSIINDIEGLCDMRLAELALNNDKKIVLMHNSWLFPPKEHSDIICSIDEFFAQKIESLNKLGIKQEQIILDIGFGFGKDDKQNIALIRNLKHFKHFGCEILIGASMKRTIGAITNKDTVERGFGTLALHQIALDNGADIIRCHDFSAHIDILKVWNAFR